MKGLLYCESLHILKMLFLTTLVVLISALYAGYNNCMTFLKSIFLFIAFNGMPARHG
jgi:hypothetical protein